MSDRCHDIRKRIVALSASAKMAHVGSCLSCVEIMDTALSMSDMSSDDRDRIIISKGHAAMGWYASLEAHGFLPKDILNKYGQADGQLWAHVSRTPHVPVIDVSTGALGHGLAIGNGYAMANRLQKTARKTTVIMSDGECDEGSVWEAALFAGHQKLHNLTVMIDYNKWQSLGATKDVINLEPLADKWRSFGWYVIEVDGHNIGDIEHRLSEKSNQPKCIIAHTVKGKGLSRIEDTLASHYKPTTLDDVDQVYRVAHA